MSRSNLHRIALRGVGASRFDSLCLASERARESVSRLNGSMDIDTQDRLFG